MADPNQAKRQKAKQNETPNTTDHNDTHMIDEEYEQEDPFPEADDPVGWHGMGEPPSHTSEYKPASLPTPNTTNHNETHMTGEEYELEGPFPEADYDENSDEEYPVGDPFPEADDGEDSDGLGDGGPV